jgi:hypothetical protein
MPIKTRARTRASMDASKIATGIFATISTVMKINPRVQLRVRPNTLSTFGRSVTPINQRALTLAPLDIDLIGIMILAFDYS